MNSKERRAWLEKITKRASLYDDSDIVARVALDEISELDERIKALESKLDSQLSQPNDWGRLDRS